MTAKRASREAPACHTVSPVKRELFFECVFVSNQSEYHFHLRAWTAAEAELAFADGLRAGGITSRGKLMVLDREGRVVRRGRYPRKAGRRPVEVAERAKGDPGPE